MSPGGAGLRDVRPDFPLLAASPGLVYLDSAATSQKPRPVLDAVRAYYETANANPHRGAYKLSGAATDAYHGARATIATFLGATDPDTLVFTRGTTESMNLLATAWGRSHVHRGDRIVVTRLEHHANFVPWQQLARAVGAEFRICELDEAGQIDIDQLRALVTANTKVVSFGHVSNALGTINDVRTIVKIAHAVGAVAFCDGAQGAAPAGRLRRARRGRLRVQRPQMLGPMGIGGVIVRRKLLEAIPPYQYGGDMIGSCSTATPRTTRCRTSSRPAPNVEGAVGLAAAVRTSRRWDGRGARTKWSCRATRSRSCGDRGTGRAGPAAAERSGVVSHAGDIHPHDLSTLLDVDGCACGRGTTARSR